MFKEMLADKDLWVMVIQVIILVGSYLVGKYILPNVPAETMSKLTYIMKWVEQFVREATTFSDKTGSEKKEYVSQQIAILLRKINVELTAEEISALIESAYLKYKEGAKEAEKEVN